MPSMLAVAIQLPVRSGAVDVNADQVMQRLTAAGRRGARLAVLPDLWTTGGLGARPRRDSELSVGAVDEVRRIAARHGMVVVGSALACERGLYYDEAHVIDADGELVGGYRRVHLVGAAASELAAGRETPTFQTAIGRIGVLLADDLFFPEQALSLAERRVRLIAAPVSWEGPALHEGATLAAARAIENQLFVVAANRARDPFEAEPQGGSVILDPQGNALAAGGARDEIVAAEIDLDDAHAERTRRPLMRARTAGASATPAAEATGETDAGCAAPHAGSVVTRDEMAAIAGELHAGGKTLVFTNGCFDILHVGHVRYLRRARALGDALCIGLNSDASVRSIKGPERPIQNEDDRAELLASLGCVDHVVVFGEDTPLDLISAVQPDVLVKGGDWTPETTVGREVVEARGGRVAILEYVAERSTTNVIDRIRAATPKPDA